MKFKDRLKVGVESFPKLVACKIFARELLNSEKNSRVLYESVEIKFIFRIRRPVSILTFKP